MRRALSTMEPMKGSVRELSPPAYLLGSVDKTLRVMHILRDGTPVRVSGIAAQLGVGVSTAHRILAMLVYHGFAVQAPDRSYIPGPALGAPVLFARDIDFVREAAGPVLEDLATRTGETVNLTLRIGPHARVLLVSDASGLVEMDRSGSVLPAHATAAGRAALAGVSVEHLEHLFRGPAAERAGADLDDDAFEGLVRELNRTRARGYALARGEAVKGISAVAVPVSAAVTRTITIAVLTPVNRLDSLLADDTRMRAIQDAAAGLGEQLRVED